MKRSFCDYLIEDRDEIGRIVPGCQKGVQLTARVQWSSLKGPPLYLSLTAIGEAEDFTRWNEGVQGRDEFALLHKTHGCAKTCESRPKQKHGRWYRRAGCVDPAAVPFDMHPAGKVSAVADQLSLPVLHPQGDRHSQG